jgi:mono/diheme cytochrome c family protein
MNFFVVIPVIAIMFAFHFVKVNALGWFAIWWFGLFVIFSFGIDPPLPSSIVFMFMGIITIVLLAYLSANTENLKSAKKTLIAFITEDKYVDYLTITAAAIPLLVAFQIFLSGSKPVEPPLVSRTIHPTPPREIQFDGKVINLVTTHNPYRELEESDMQAFADHLENGRRVYVENCVFCHGDDMKGNGIYAYGFDPIPANFADPTTIAMLQENYLFWRIAKGGPGLPDESTPWSSAMPAWEKFLTEEEIWDVILFLYDYTDQKPRAIEEIEK